MNLLRLQGTRGLMPIATGPAEGLGASSDEGAPDVFLWMVVSEREIGLCGGYSPF